MPVGDLGRRWPAEAPVVFILVASVVYDSRCNRPRVHL
jgi:hypothetical protein